MLTRRISARLQAIVHAVAVSTIVATMVVPGQAVAIDLADQPLFSTNSVPGNLLLALSVEWPTASTPAYLSTSPYSAVSAYLGYFDPQKCYRYVVQTPEFPPAISPRATLAHEPRLRDPVRHKPLWSGNYLNWASTQTLDAFRWALTGGPACSRYKSPKRFLEKDESFRTGRPRQHLSRQGAHLRCRRCHTIQLVFSHHSHLEGRYCDVDHWNGVAGG